MKTTAISQPHRVKFFDRTIVTWFHDTPTPDSMREWLQVLHSHARPDGQKHWVIVVIPEGHKPPGPWIARAIADSVETFRAVVDGLTFVIEGDGFSQSIRRSVVTGILLAAKVRPGHTHVVASLDEAIDKLVAPFTAPSLRADITRASVASR